MTNKCKYIILLISLLFLFACQKFPMNSNFINSSSNKSSKVETVVITNFNSTNNLNSTFLNDSFKIKKLNEVLDNAKWTTSKRQMSKDADYRLHFKSKSSLYDIWISPNGKKLEIIEYGFRYVKLDEKNSKEILDILLIE